MGYSPWAAESDATEHARHTKILCSHSDRHCKDHRKKIVYTLEQTGSVLLSDSSAPCALHQGHMVMHGFFTLCVCVVACVCCCVCVCSTPTCKLFMHHLLL